MTDAPIDVVKRCFMAYAESDRAAIEAVIDDSLSFISPLDNGIDRATYFERCWPNHETVAGFEFMRLMAEKDEVCVTYVGTTKSGSKFQNTEVLTVRGGKIIRIEVYFGWNVPHPAKAGGWVNDG